MLGWWGAFGFSCALVFDVAFDLSVDRFPFRGDAWEVVFQIFFGECAVVVLEAACISEGVEPIQVSSIQPSLLSCMRLEVAREAL